MKLPRIAFNADALLKFLIATLFFYALFGLSKISQAMDLSLTLSTDRCGQALVVTPVAPAEANLRLANSLIAHGSKNIVWAWLGSPTLRYPHRSLGAYSHAASVHVLVKQKSGELSQLNYELPIRKVFEDLTPRLIDLNGDGEDELVLIESDAALGAALVVLGVRQSAAKPGLEPGLVIQELARSPNIGIPFRWMNPVGAADFDSDGRLDLAAIHTPHIGGVLTLYHYQPPHLKAFARLTDVSNHRMGSAEQRLAVIVPPSGQQTRPTVIVPDTGLKALYALRWVETGQWREIASVKALPAGITSMTPSDGGACAQLADGSWWKIGLMH